MKKIAGIVIAIALMVGIGACSQIEEWDIGRYFGSIIVLGAYSENTTEVEGNIMAVFYAKSEGIALFWCTDAQIVDGGDGKWDVSSPQCKVIGVSQALVDYGLYKYQPMPDLGSGNYTLGELNLQAITWEDLKRSMHAAGLVDVYMVNDSPRATVRRFYMGKTYDIPNCRVSQTVYDNWHSGKIEVYNDEYGWLTPENENCFVMVYFLSETPFNNELMIPVIVDKVIK